MLICFLYRLWRPLSLQRMMNVTCFKSMVLQSSYRMWLPPKFCFLELVGNQVCQPNIYVMQLTYLWEVYLLKHVWYCGFSITVGALLQTKFTSGGGLFSQFPEAPFSGIPQKLSKSLASESPWPSLGPSFLLPAPPPEPTLRTVGARRLGGPVPLESSITLGKGRLLMDAALFRGRSFRVGWGPNWTLVHCGDQLSVTEAMKEQSAEIMGFGFLPKPTKSKP